MKARPFRSRALAAIDAQINAKAEALLARMAATRARMQEELDAARAVDIEKTLAAHPNADSLEFQKLIAAIQKYNRTGARRTEADRRRANIIRMSLSGMSVRLIAEEVGLSYYYVVQLRRELGLSKRRKRR